LEEISSTKVENVGAYAFAVLEALSSPTSSDDVRDSVARVQKHRREEQRLLAQKKRNRAMKSMKAVAASTAATSSSSSSTKKQKRWVDEMTQLEEEDSALVCIVCHEGYRSKPQQMICAYTWEKSLGLPLGGTFLTGSGLTKQVGSGASGQQPPVWCLSSTSAFVCIHQSCHETAARTDRSHPKAPKDEWEGAELRNGHIKCNNLIPLRGSTPLPVYDSAVHAFFERVDRDTKVKIGSAVFTNDPSLFSLIAHDLRLLFVRMSYGENLTEDTKGGSIESNLKLMVPLMQMGQHFLNVDTNHKSNAEALLVSFISNPKDMTNCDFAFACVLAIFLLDHSRWNEVRFDSFLKGALAAYAAKVQANALHGDPSSVGSGVLSASSLQAAAAVAGSNRARSRSRARSLSVSGGGLEESLLASPTNAAVSSSSAAGEGGDVVPKHIRPWLVYFGLVDRVMLSNTQPPSTLSDKVALEATQILAQDARQMIVSCHSVSIMAGLLRLTPEELKNSLSWT
jgi:E3 ubiquitin-protein ligase UBR4